MTTTTLFISIVSGLLVGFAYAYFFVTQTQKAFSTSPEFQPSFTTFVMVCWKVFYTYHHGIIIVFLAACYLTALSCWFWH